MTLDLTDPFDWFTGHWFKIAKYLIDAWKITGYLARGPGRFCSMFLVSQLSRYHHLDKEIRFWPWWFVVKPIAFNIKNRTWKKNKLNDDHQHHHISQRHHNWNNESGSDPRRLVDPERSKLWSERIMERWLRCISLSIRVLCSTGKYWRLGKLNFF